MNIENININLYKLSKYFKLINMRNQRGGGGTAAVIYPVEQMKNDLQMYEIQLNKTMNNKNRMMEKIIDDARKLNPNLDKRLARLDENIKIIESNIQDLQYNLQIELKR